jgi:uncharacterized protein YjiS (DUF1127 family)
MLQRNETKFLSDALDRGRWEHCHKGAGARKREIDMAIHSNDQLFASRSQIAVVPALMAGLEKFFGWWTRSQARHTLANLDERTLRDIGVSKTDVYREALKPFWRS